MSQNKKISVLDFMISEEKYGPQETRIERKIFKN